MANDRLRPVSEWLQFVLLDREAGTGRLRFIEAEGQRADARAVTVTRNEMPAAYNARDACIPAVAPVERGIA